MMCQCTAFMHVWFCVGWNDELKDGKISIYQVKVLEHGAEDVPFEFTQDDMSDIRRLIAFQLLRSSACFL